MNTAANEYNYRFKLTDYALFDRNRARQAGSQGCTSRASVQQEIICCSNRIKMVQKPRKIKVFRGFTVSKRADIV